MKAFEAELKFATDGDGSIIDLTDRIRSIVGESGIRTGQLITFVPGSTGAVTTIEFEPGLLKDMPELLEKLIPSGVEYNHDATWGDGNGFSHLRAAIVGPSLTVPLSDGKLVLGTWQQIVFLEFDNRARQRRIYINILGE
jgi:secondary thiamine-phosphate synthase enzyme